MRVGVPSVLREEPQFARYFAGQLLSVLGDRITMVALPFAVLSVGGSASDVGLVAAAALVPFLLFALVGGVWADRLPRHRVMLASDVVRGVLQAAIAALLLSGTARVWHLVVLMGLFGIADAFFTPAATGLMPLVVSQHRLQEANALRGFTFSTGVVIGPVVAGALIAGFGPGGAIALDAATFGVSAYFLARLNPRAPESTAEHAPFLRQLVDGFAEVRSRSWLWATMGVVSVYHVIVLPSVFVLGPVLAEREFGGAAGWAAVVTGFGVGSIVGDLIALRVRVRRPLIVAAVAFAVSSCQALVIGAGPNLLVIAALEAVTGVAVSLAFTLWETALQEHVPQASLSRVSSYDHLVSTGLMAVGLAVAGPAADAFGMRPTLFAMTAVGAPAALLLLALPAVRALRSAPAVPAAVPVATA
ncbi:MFS transporter [Catellatospora sp. TT07R-123]|uniref:MFS transporter n=1 Tax=Catellatospora sp. TT07R-123 TaxID=2733863 RepID=UPI001B065746|nr:MFS transporter [Catellatospora sp. TT07R-123]GHJ48768.1 MFS transporter [Catellatospora sp. TT07R-123]